MKTIEEKAKAYDEIIERAKTMLAAGEVMYGKENNASQLITDLIPGLAESEDERIRKCICMALTDVDEQRFKDFGTTLKDCLAYLERQKEQKPTSFNEPYNPDEYEVVMEGNATSLKQKEQKPVESISQLTVQGKGVYKICPRCKERMVRDDSKVYTSMPPQYGYVCPKCGEMEFDTVMYDNPEMVVQKPAWSEEDEQFLLICKNALRKYQISDHWDANIISNWLEKRLKSLRPQPKQEWGEGDERILKGIIGKIDHDQTYGVSKADMLSFLNRIRPSWKPSEDQMAVLLNAEGLVRANKYTENAKILAKLYEELKKL